MCYGLNGFEPSWDVAARIDQIIKHGIMSAGPKPPAARILSSEV